MSGSGQQRHRVFVYGILKSAGDPERGLAARWFARDARGEESPTLVCVDALDGWSLATRYSGVSPGSGRRLSAGCAYAYERVGAHVVGETWDVGPNMLAALDRLEGHPVHYRRTSVRTRAGYVADIYRGPSRAHPETGQRYPLGPEGALAPDTLWIGPVWPCTYVEGSVVGEEDFEGSVVGERV